MTAWPPAECNFSALPRLLERRGMEPRGGASPASFSGAIQGPFAWPPPRERSNSDAATHVAALTLDERPRDREARSRRCVASRGARCALFRGARALFRPATRRSPQAKP